MWCSNQKTANFSDEPTSSNYRLHKCEEMLAVARDRTVSVYEKDALREMLALNFDSEVNAVCWADKAGRFLLVAEHSGLLHTVHIRSQRVINSERVYHTYNDVTETFQQVLCVEEANVLFVLGSGVIHGFTNMDYGALDQALCEGSMQKALTLRQQVVHTTTQTLTSTTSLIPDIQRGKISLLTTGEEARCLSLLLYADGEWSADLGSALLEYGTIQRGFRVSRQHLLTLTDKGVLILWSLLTHTAARIWANNKIEQAAPLTSPSTRLSDSKIVVYGRLAGRDTRSLSILSLPSCDILYNLPVSDVVLADEYVDQLSVHYICGTGTDAQLTSIALISPEARYEMMISKHQHDEALVFAKMHQLDTQVVYAAWAKLLSVNLTVDGAIAFRRCLEELSDVHGVTDICLGVVSPSGELVHRALKYAMKRLEASHHTNCICDRVAQVFTTLQRFATFSSAYGPTHFTPDGWHSFLHCNLSEEALRLATSESMPAAMAIWARHKCELQTSVSIDWLDEFLQCISSSMDYNSVLNWLLHHLIPIIDRREAVSYSELLARHVERLARDYELSDQDRWPCNSLALVSSVDMVNSALLSPSLARLKLLRDNLQAIKELRDLYQCRLSYAQYCEQTRESIVYRLLDIVKVPSMFTHHYEKVARPYMMQYCIHADKNLLNYVKDLITRYQYLRGYDSTGLLWEQKAVAVVDCISQNGYKVSAVVELAKHCATPWSKCIAELVDSTCLLVSEDIEELCNVRHQSILSHLLASYNVPKEVIPSPRNALMLIKFILKNSGASLSGVRHALQVGQALTIDDEAVYLHACQTRLMNLEDVTDLVEAMSGDVDTQVITRLINQCVQFCNQPAVLDWAIKSHWIEVSVSLLTNRSADIADSYFDVPLDCLASQLKSVILLKMEFDIDVTLSVLNCPTETLAQMSVYLKTLILQDPKCSKEGSAGSMQSDLLLELLTANMWRLESLAKLLYIRKSNLYEIIYTELSSLSPHTTTGVLTLILRKDNSEETVSFSLSKLSSLVQANECSVTNVKDLLRLAQVCVAHAEEGQLLDATRLVSVLSLQRDVMSNCLGGDDKQDVTSEADRSELETIYNRKYYIENDLMVNTSQVKAQTGELLTFIVAPADKMADSEGDMYLEEHKSCYELLKSNNHDLLCLRMTLHLYYSVTRLSTSSPSLVKLRNHLNSKLKVSTTSLLTKLMAQRNLDVHLTLAALLDLPIGASLSLVKKNAGSFGSQFLRIMSLANVALVICATNDQPEYLQKCVLLKKESVWGYMLSKYGVNYLPVFGKASNKGQLLTKLASRCPLDVINKYISDFGLTPDTARTYLTRVLHLADKHSQTAFWTQSTESDALLTEITHLLAKIPHDTSLEEAVLDSCNPYNYALIKTILTSSADSSQNLKLLDFLALYKRHAGPSDWEINYIKMQHLEKGGNSLPDISSTRLPYQPLVNGHIWKIFRTELTVKTFQILQPITSLLKIENDKFLLNTAVQVAESHIGHLYKKSGPSADGDVITPNWSTDDSKFFGDIMTVLAAIQDKETAVMCSQSLVDKLPCGTEKVLVTKICVDLARNWVSSLNQESERYSLAMAVLRKISGMYTILSIEQCLYRHDLASDSHLQLIEHPIHLIQSILETTHVDSAQRAEEKFEACCSLAEITGRDIRKTCYDIITSWLSLGNPDTQANIDMDMTMTMDMANMMAAAVEESTNNSSQDYGIKEKWIVNLANSRIGHTIVHLLNSVLNGISTNNRTKLLVVRCFLLLGDTSLASLTNGNSPLQDIQLTHEELSRQYKALRYIDRLQKLNISMSVEDFYSCDLGALIARLRKNYSNNPAAIELYADMCIETSNYDVTTWKVLLQQLMQLNMFEKLVEMLTLSTNQTQLWKLDVYKQGWQLVAEKAGSDAAAGVAMMSCPLQDALRR